MGLSIKGSDSRTHRPRGTAIGGAYRKVRLGMLVDAVRLDRVLPNAARQGFLLMSLASQQHALELYR